MTLLRLPLGFRALSLLVLVLSGSAAAASTPLRRNALQAAAVPSTRNLVDISDLACYGNYCGFQDSCVGDKLLSPEQRQAPIDALDAACFLHDVCYTCSSSNQNGTQESCCPDATLIGVDKAECDRVLLHRLKNDDLCDSSQNDNSTLLAAASVPELAGCDATRQAAIAIFEVLLAGREFVGDITGNGRPSATNSVNATCPAFQCPFTDNSACFQPCGDDGCGSQCGDGRDSEQGPGSCPSGQVCDPYAHACFFPRSPDGSVDGPSAASHTSSPVQWIIALVIAAVAGWTATAH